MKWQDFSLVSCDCAINEISLHVPVRTRDFDQKSIICNDIPAMASYHRFGSFAPVREGANDAKWFVDGQEYMAAVADAIMAGKHEIFITDWQMNPHIFMKRPDKGITSLKWRLDKMLLRKAEEGVRVYILLYWETTMVMDLGSEYAQSILSHRNIEVHRHPTFSTVASNPTTLMRWSHHEKVVVVDRSIAFVGGIDLCFGRWDTHSHALTDDHPPHPSVLGEEEPVQSGAGEPTQYCRWVGKDYGNTFLGGGRKELNKPLEDYIARREVPRMPWHDVACSFSGDAALDVARHFIQRYNYINQSMFSLLSNRQLSIENWSHPEVCHAIPDPSASNVNIQILRSVGSWSTGQPREDSIHKAYLHAIENAEHLIYIENQFFISSQPNEYPCKVENEIQLALSKRIVRAYKNAEDFHVIIILPLQPEFPGDWGTDSGKDLEAVSYWNYATLYSGEDSLVARLKKEGVSAEFLPQYLSVYGLRTYDVLDSKLVTEIIYVHSKLMIVDDRLAIIGSANINDRSMLGDRDSEVDVMIEDRDRIDGRMNGKVYRVGKFSHGLRCHLLKDHLGLLNEKDPDIKVEDPLMPHFYMRLSEIASWNTAVYERVFHRKVLPTNQVQNYTDLENWKTFDGLADILPDEAKDELSQIRGRIVIFPALFLKDVLKPSALDYLKVYVDRRGFSSELSFDTSQTFFC